jgi:beta-galactosidase
MKNLLRPSTTVFFLIATLRGSVWAEAPADEAALPKPVPHFSTAGFFPVEGAARTVADFDPGWRFHKGDVPNAQDPAFDDSTWEAANLPHGLEILGANASGGHNYQGPAWYRKKFAAPAQGGKVYLYFEAVMGKCTVWVNGHQMTRHFGGYLPFVVDATPVLKAGGQGNVVAVLADNSDDPTYPPGKPQGDLDFTYMGGIYRNVYLIRTPEVHVTFPELSKTVAGGGVFVATKDVNDNDASLEVRTEVANDSARAESLTVRSVLQTPDGNDLLAAETPLHLAAGGTQQISQSLEPKNVHLWSPNDPYLHFIRTEIMENGKVEDTLRTRFGIRLFEMRGLDGFYINKKYIGVKLSGVNRHQDYRYIGNAQPNATEWRDVKLLREGGSNVIRAAHYPTSPAFYDACDELGMLVTTANPGWQFFNFDNPIFEQRLYEDTHALVRRDRNRPSMLLWETVINEEPDQPARVLQGMNQAAHDEYPFPGFYTVGDADEAKKGGMNFYYYGNDPKINSFWREYADGGMVDNFFSQNAKTRVDREWGEGPLLGQAISRAHDLDGVYAAPPHNIGAALWCGIDHFRGYHPDPFWGGLLDSARIPRYAYYLFKSQYDPDLKLHGVETGPMVKITNELTQVSAPDVIVYSNCEEVRLTWLGQVVATQKPDAGYPHLPHPPFTFRNVFNFDTITRDWREKTGKIEMVAEGLMGGKVVATEVKKYPERTTGVQLTVDDQGVGLTADGSDFVPLRATIVDNKGVPKVLAEEYVYFKVEGPGEIIGGPGTQANPAKTEFGTATALLRSTLKPGVIKVTAYVRGLAPGEVHVASRAPALPLAYDASYAAASKPPENGAALIVGGGTSTGGDETEKLKEQVHQLQLELTSKEQDLMDLRNKMNK